MKPGCSDATTTGHRRTPIQPAGAFRTHEFLSSLMPRQPVAKTTKRVWASLEREPGAVVAEAMLEAERHDPERVKRWVVLIDGAETQLDLVEAGAAAYGVQVTVVLDIIHVVEYVWKAAGVFHRERGAPSWRAGPGRACGTFSRARPAGWRRRCDVRRPSPASRATPASRSIRARTTWGVPASGPRPDGVDRRPLAPGRRRGGVEAPGVASQRRLRCVLGLPRSPRVGAEPRPALR